MIFLFSFVGIFLLLSDFMWLSRILFGLKILPDNMQLIRDNVFLLESHRHIYGVERLSLALV